jgi:hypothetical protein
LPLPPLSVTPIVYSPSATAPDDVNALDADEPEAAAVLAALAEALPEALEPDGEEQPATALRAQTSMAIAIPANSFRMVNLPSNSNAGRDAPMPG